MTRSQRCERARAALASTARAPLSIARARAEKSSDAHLERRDAESGGFARERAPRRRRVADARVCARARRDEGDGDAEVENRDDRAARCHVFWLFGGLYLPCSRFEQMARRHERTRKTDLLDLCLMCRDRRLQGLRSRVQALILSGLGPTFKSAGSLKRDRLHVLCALRTRAVLRAGG